MLGTILLQMGFSAIDDNLQNLVNNLGDFPAESIMGELQGWAKTIGLCIALGVGSYECYMMMLGKKGMDVMKILHIIIISICITCANWICEAAAAPGKALSEMSYNMAQSTNGEVKAKEQEIIELQKKYIKKLDEIITKAQMEKNADNKVSKDEGLIDLGISDAIDEFKTNIEFRLKKTAVTIETKVCEWLSIIIRFIGEVIFQITYYGFIVASTIFMHVLAAFCPIAFAMSLAPPYRSAWSQWLSKYLSLSLWAFIVYLIVYYVNYIMLYNLGMDIENYNALLGQADATDWESIGSIGMQGLGTTCMYVVGLLIGVMIMKFVPEVASWLIPGGASSSVGGTVGAAAVAPIAMAGSAAAATATGGASLAGQIGQKAQDNLTGKNLG